MLENLGSYLPFLPGVGAYSGLAFHNVGEKELLETP